MFKKVPVKKKEGFTIIEVMIVLAIAGLILVVVLIAIPQLQRNQRNNARQSLLARVSTELSSYAGNNSGAFPDAVSTDNAGDFGSAKDDDDSFVGKYLEGVNIVDPSTGEDVEFSFGVANEPDAEGAVTYALNAECGADGEFTDLGSGNGRKFALGIWLEGNRVYCLDNK